MISVHSWNLFDDLRIVIADAAVQKNRAGSFSAPGEIARRLPAAQKLLFQNDAGRMSSGAGVNASSRKSRLARRK
jgi:hypothetical protein